MTRNIEVQLASPFSGYLIKYWCLNDTSQCFDRWNTLYRVWQITPTFWKFFTFSVSVFRCVFVNIQLVIMSAGQRILILEALLVKVLFRCTIARIWGLAERSCFRKTLLWVLSLSLSVRERCVFNKKERKSNKHFYWYDNFSVSGSSRTTLISSSKRPDRIGTTVVANVGFCEGRKLEFLRGKTLNRGREALRNSSR